MDIKPKGGRGHTAPYQTTHLRVPVALKQEFEYRINAYRQQVMSAQVDHSQQTPLNDVSLGDGISSKDEAIEIAKKILKGKKSARQSMSKLLTALYGEEINL